MENPLGEIVHIIPLGHEYDRAIRPFDTVKANCAYLIVDTGDGTSHGTSTRDKTMQGIQDETYTPRVKEYLEQKGINVTIIRTQTFELMKLLTTISGIIRLEKAKGNQVFINMSSSGRLGAVAASLAGMAHNIPVYYVHSDHFANDTERPISGQSVCPYNQVTILPQFFIGIPDETESVILQKIYSEKIENDASLGVSGLELINLLESKKIVGFIEHNPPEQPNMRVIQSRKLMRLMTIMNRMEEKQYVTKEKIGRKMLYKITITGEYALHISGIESLSSI